MSNNNIKCNTTLKAKSNVVNPNQPRDQSWTKLEEPIRGLPSNSYNIFGMVGFGAFCGTTHNTFCVKKHPTNMSPMGEELLFSLKIHINFIF
jgi:hypothetical protein